MVMVRTDGQLSVALIGYGAIAGMHARALRALGVRLAVVSGPKAAEAEQFAHTHGVEHVASDVDEAISRSDVDAVVVASPNAVHAAQARAGLNADKHVLVEIPLALSLVDAEALVLQASQANRILMVCHTLRYWEPMVAGQRWLSERNEPARHIVARALSRRHENVGWTGRQRSWIDDLLWHGGGHAVDVVLGFFDSPVVDVRAEVGPVWKESGRPMDYAIGMRTATGAIGTIALSYHARIAASDYLVVGENETVFVSETEARSTTGPLISSSDFATIEAQAMLDQDRDFVESIQSGRAPIAAAAAVLPTMRVLQAVQDQGDHRGS